MYTDSSKDANQQYGDSVEKCVYEGCPDPINNIYADERNGDYVCRSCGCCQPDRIMAEAEERRSFMEDGIDRRRTSIMYNIFDFEMPGTTIVTKGNNYESRKKQKLNVQLGYGDMTGDVKTVQAMHKNLDTLSTIDSIRQIVVNSAKTYGEELVKELRKKNIKVRNLRSMACAVALLYSAVQKHQDGKSLKELCDISVNEKGKHLTEKNVAPFIKLIKAHVNIDNQSTNPKDMIRNIVSNLNQPFVVERTAVDIFEEWMTKNSSMLCSRKPSTIAGAAVSVAMDKIKAEIATGNSKLKLEDFNPNISLADIAAIATVAEGTLKNFLKEMREKNQ
jgi:transcription initiation factor TFIIIB Brf1 subunit/transcription initiation factor TFIIB